MSGKRKFSCIQDIRTTVFFFAKMNFYTTSNIKNEETIKEKWQNFEIHKGQRNKIIFTSVLQAEKPRLQFCRRQVFHCKLRNQGCSFTRDLTGAFRTPLSL